MIGTNQLTVLCAKITVEIDLINENISYSLILNAVTSNFMCAKISKLVFKQGFTEVKFSSHIKPIHNQLHWEILDYLLK